MVRCQHLVDIHYVIQERKDSFKTPQSFFERGFQKNQYVTKYVIVDELLIYYIYRFRLMLN